MQIDPQTDINIVPATPPRRCKHAPPVGQSSILTRTRGILNGNMNIECATKIEMITVEVKKWRKKNKGHGNASVLI